MKVVWTKLALQSLREELIVVRRENPVAAQDITARIFSRIEQLKINPYLAPQYKLKGVRRLSLSNYPYSIYYRPREKLIEILQIRHEARKPVQDLH